MYAIVNIAGQQFKVEKDQKIFVHRLESKEGDSVNFDEVLLIDNDKSVLVGEPTIKGARISCKVISHPKGDKVEIFKKKRRKGYKVHRGHRQYLTEIQIQDIIEKGATKEAPAKAEPKAAVREDVPAAKPPTKAKTTAAKATTKTDAPAAKESPTKEATTAKKAAPAAKKAATKKPAAKKPAAKKAAGKTTGKASPAPKASAQPAAKKQAGNKK